MKRKFCNMIKRRFSGFMIAVIMILFSFPLYCEEMTPKEALKTPIDSIIGILKDPAYQDKTKKSEQRAKIWEQVPEIFDFQEMGKRSLGKYGNMFNDKQKEEYVGLFTKLIGNTYLDKVQAEYNGEDVVFTGEEMITPDKAVVNTVIPRKTIEIPINYSLKKDDGKWRVYDVNIEGVSLVKNYRSQFASILRSDSADAFLTKLKEKVKE